MRSKSSTHIDTVTTESIDRLQARLFFLMTRYTTRPCQQLAEHIVESLILLCQHPHIQLMPAQQHIYSQSVNLWRSRITESVPKKVNAGH